MAFPLLSSSLVVVPQSFVGLDLLQQSISFILGLRFSLLISLVLLHINLQSNSCSSFGFINTLVRYLLCWLCFLHSIHASNPPQSIYFRVSHNVRLFVDIVTLTQSPLPPFSESHNSRSYLFLNIHVSESYVNTGHISVL